MALPLHIYLLIDILVFFFPICSCFNVSVNILISCPYAIYLEMELLGHLVILVQFCKGPLDIFLLIYIPTNNRPSSKSCFLSLLTLNQIPPSASAMCKNLACLDYCRDWMRCMVSWQFLLPLSPCSPSTSSFPSNSSHAPNTVSYSVPEVQHPELSVFPAVSFQPSSQLQPALECR